MSQISSISKHWNSVQFWINFVYVLSFVITMILAIIVILAVGYDLTFRTSIFEWWKSTDDTEVWVCIYLWVIQLVFLKMTELISDLHTQTTDKLIISIKVFLSYALSVLIILLTNAGLLIYFTCT